MKKILIAAPIYNGVDYCLLDFVNHLKAIDYNNFDILLIDNSRSKKFFRNVRKIKGIKLLYDDTDEEKNMLRLISSRNKILAYALENNYDYLLMMDADVMVPSDILFRLLAHNKDVVSGLYFNVFYSSKKPKFLPVAYKHLEKQIFEKMVKDNLVPEDFTQEDLRRNITQQEIEKGELLEVLFPSGGCLLLSRKALESGAKYGLMKLKGDLKSSDDIYFFKELREKGFKLYCDPKIVCKHDIAKKYENELHPVYE